MSPTIKKAKLVAGRSLSLRNVVVEDAQFILSLRLDPRKSRHLSATSSDLDDQVSWLRNYEGSADQAYFIVSDNEGRRLGCLRIYDAVGDSYCWGSWLMVDGLGPLVSIEAVLLVYAYARHLGFRSARLNVMKANTYVWRFHEKIFGARKVAETGEEYFYEVDGPRILESLEKYAQLIPEPLRVVPV
ncbi:MAG: hypothetical protein JWQ33_3108 [Ramlibacter sp.]|nr:hypothetical protein [Ramlibacter sp.]